MKKILYSIFAILLCLMIFSNDEKIEAEELYIYDFDYISNIMKKDKTGMSSLSLNKNTKKEKTFEYDEYIDDYAGSFVKDGQLVILTTKDNNESRSRLNKSNQTRTVKFSMNQLNDAMNDINLYKKYHGETYIAKQFNLYWLDVENNQIVVELDNLTEENIKLFKNEVLNKEFIVFRQIEAKPENEVSIYPGSKINIKWSSSSVAYRATRNGVKGIVISGHAGKVGDNVYSNGKLIGNIQVRQEYGAVDASFVKTNNNFTLSNSVSSRTLSNNVQNLNVGSTVKKIGYVTGITSGKVTKNNVSITLGGVTHFNLVGANYKSDRGDSGGLVFFEVPGENLTNTVGVHVGSVGSTKYYCRASEVNKALNLKRYWRFLYEKNIFWYWQY